MLCFFLALVTIWFSFIIWTSWPSTWPLRREDGDGEASRPALFPAGLEGLRAARPPDDGVFLLVVGIHVLGEEDGVVGHRGLARGQDAPHQVAHHG